MVENAEVSIPASARDAGYGAWLAARSLSGRRRIFVASTAGELLEVFYPSWKTGDPSRAEELRTIWLERRKSLDALDQSGVWRFREPLPPALLAPCAGKDGLSPAMTLVANQHPRKQLTKPPHSTLVQRVQRLPPLQPNRPQLFRAGRIARLPRGIKHFQQFTAVDATKILRRRSNSVPQATHRNLHPRALAGIDTSAFSTNRESSYIFRKGIAWERPPSAVRLSFSPYSPL